VLNRREFVGSLISAGIAAITVPRSACALNYDDLIPLDAEDLAEFAFKSTYQALRPALLRYIPSVAPIEERFDHDNPSFTVIGLGQEYFIHGGSDQDESWGNATFAFFDIVNRQLQSTRYRFFAFNGGNDLSGMFLSLEEAEAAKSNVVPVYVSSSVITSSSRVVTPRPPFGEDAA